MTIEFLYSLYKPELNFMDTVIGPSSHDIRNVRMKATVLKIRFVDQTIDDLELYNVDVFVFKNETMFSFRFYPTNDWSMKYGINALRVALPIKWQTVITTCYKQHKKCLHYEEPFSEVECVGYLQISSIEGTFNPPSTNPYAIDS